MLRASYLTDQKKMIKTNVENVINFINYRKHQSETELKKQIKGRVKEAFSVAMEIIANSPDIETAKKSIKTVLASIRYKHGAGYYFIIDTTDSKIILTSKQGSEELNSLDQIQKLIKAGNENETGTGYVSYKLNKSKFSISKELKTFCVKLIPELNWVIGTGLYTSDVKAEIEDDIFQYISKIRFGKNNDSYIFAFDSEGVELANGTQPQLVGKNLYNLEDAKGVKVVQQEIEVATKEPDGDFLTYWWHKTSTGKPSPKISFIKGIKEWPWFIGAGVYLDDVEEIISEREVFYKKRIKTLFFTNLIVLFSLLIFSIFLSRLLSLRLKKNFAEFGSFYKTAANEFIPIDKHGLTFLEFIDLADSMNQMISDHNIAEGELSYLRNYLSNIIDSMPSIIIGVDKECNIKQWNREACKRTGFSSEKVLGQPLEKIYPSMSAEVGRVKEAIRSRQVSFKPRQNTSESGEILYEDVTIFPLIAKGIEGAVIRVDDVTERVQMEEVMIQSEKMVSVGGLAAGMAHEINNPLAGMMQSASIIKMRLQDIDMPANRNIADEIGISMEAIRQFMEERKILRMIDIISESGQRVVKIVQNMLSFSRKTDASVSPHNPEHLLDQALELATTDCNMKKIKIIKEYDEKLPLVLCERSKIQQVILNILNNGTQAMQDGFSNQDKTPCFILRLSVNKEKKMLKIEVKDNGPGMDQKTKKRVFEPFFTTKSEGVGTGLGLSVSYFIVTENHKGTMTVDSELGKGTTFIIQLPIGPAHN